MTKLEATQQFEAADKAWQAELVRTFGAREAGNARYEKRGRGEPGTALHKAHTAREAARQTFSAVVGGNVA